MMNNPKPISDYLLPGKRAHLVGIGGVSMRPLGLVLRSMGIPEALARGALRFSLCADNTLEQMDTIVAAVTDVVDYLRNMSPLWRDKCCGKREFLLK